MRFLAFRKTGKGLPENFCKDWYASFYRDVVASGISPENHYLRYGHIIGRDPNPYFSTKFVRRVFGLGSREEPGRALAERLAAGQKPDVAQVLVAAGDVAAEGRHELAIELAETWLPDELAYTANLLKANRCILASDLSGWNSHVNSYLSALGVGEITLCEADTLFNRLLGSAPSRVVDQGPLVSVLMAAWNAQDTVEMAVRSVLQQGWRNLELIVVDDCSTDGTWDILNRIAATDPRLRIFRNEINAGPYVSKNFALSQSKGAWITGHDADDWAHPDRVASQVAWLGENKESACLSGMLRMSERGEFVRFNPIGGNVIDGACRNAFISLMVDAHVFHGGLGYWDEVRVGGDSELIHRLQSIRGKELQTVPKVTMLCLDNPVGLTNLKGLGHSESGGVSPHRRAYKRSFTKFHATIAPQTARLEFAAPQRRFKAASEMLNAAQTAATLMQSYAAKGFGLKRDVSADIAIITNLAFQGGNTSSTLDELEYLLKIGANVVLVHCPTLRDVARPVSTKFDKYADITINWSKLGKLEADTVIVRHPVVVTAPSFKQIAPSIAAENLFMVVNNSRYLADGREAYSVEDMVRVLSSLSASQVTLCPISGAMRAELAGVALPLSQTDWLPTLDSNIYEALPKRKFGRTIRIGRHGRDGVEKWVERKADLLHAYPSDPSISVRILGGARNATKIAGSLPTNWKVYKFGEKTALEYLKELDVFVYFPKTGLVEAFGRAVAEAMLAGVPCILPPKFEPTFGELAFYCEPESVRALIDRLGSEDKQRVAFLTNVQDIVRSLHAPSAIAARIDLARASKSLGSAAPSKPAFLTDENRNWRSRMLEQMVAAQ